MNDQEVGVLELVLGVDTSNYTTSLCAITWEDGRLVSDARRRLPVAQGQRGLRQSDALFFHVNQLPEVMSELMGAISVAEVRWRGIGVSVRPRPLSVSYMPVFLAGTRFAETLALTAGLPLVRISHQEGHLAAADHFLQLHQTEPAIAVHLSGGTSDVLYARRTRFGYNVEGIGSSQDLNAGQFVDRVGVALGLPFPAGPELEALAKSAETNPNPATGTSEHGFAADRYHGDLRFASSVDGAAMSFSGPCSAALRAVEKGVPGPVVAGAVFACIANSLVKAISYAAKQYPEARVCVLAGGVMANAWIRERIQHRLRIVCPDLSVQFARPEYSSDNGLGAAVIARRFLR